MHTFMIHHEMYSCLANNPTVWDYFVLGDCILMNAALSYNISHCTMQSKWNTNKQPLCKELEHFTNNFTQFIPSPKQENEILDS